MSGLVRYIRKRYQSPRWVVIEEVNEATGGNAGRRADAVAVGIWPSDGMTIHGFECKVSRGDVQKELADPRKADAIGKYCDHWWLVVDDLKIISGLEIPETWGILYRFDTGKPESKRPDGKDLVIKRKAPKREVKPITRSFQAAVIRRVVEGWVSKVAFDAYKETAAAEAKKEVERDLKHRREDQNYELTNLQNNVKAFEQASGLKIADAPTWSLHNLGEITKLIQKGREISGTAHNTHWRVEAKGLLVQEINSLERSIAHHKGAALNVEHALTHLRNYEASIKETE